MDSIPKLFSQFKHEFFHQHEASSFQFSYFSWLVIIMFWLSLTVITGIHCFVYTLLFSSKTVSWISAVQWAAIRWCPWIIITPLLVKYAHRLNEHQWQTKLSLKILLGLAFTWCLGLALLIAFYHVVTADEILQLAPAIYFTVMKEVPLSVLIIISFFYGWRYMVANQTEKITTENSPLIVESRTGKQCLDIANLEYISASGNYVNFYMIDGEHFLHRATMKETMSLLGEEQFIRIHRSHIVNRKAIKQVSSGSHGELKLMMASGQNATVSRHYAKQLRAQYNGSLQEALLRSS